jgi:hypothetical protein
MMDWIAKTEKPITSKTRVMRAQNKTFKHFLKYCITDLPLFLLIY